MVKIEVASQNQRMETHGDRSHPHSLDAWLRWLPFWRAFFILTLIGLTIAVILNGGVDIPQVLFLSVLMLIWYGVSLRWQSRPTDMRAVYLLAYHAVGWLVWFALTDLNPAYLFVLFALFPHLFMSLPLRWASIGAMMLMSLTILRQIMLPNQGLDTWLILFSITTIAGIILAAFIEAIIKESTVRRELIHKLESTQRELAVAERQAGIMDERQRLAGEIHDTVAQGLISIITHLEAADAGLDSDAQQHIDQAKKIARSSLTEARRFIRGMRPEALEKQPFELAVKQMVDEWSASNRIPAAWQVTGTRVLLSSEQETVLLRVIQEALANITKHAQAQRVNITLSYLPDTLIVDIQDDGHGFDLTAQPINPMEHAGYGLRNMRERLESVQGQLTVESAPNEGTTVVAEIRLSGEPINA